MAYTGYIYDVIDAATMYVRVQVTPQNTDTSAVPLPPTLHKYITSHPYPGMNAYLTDISDLHEKMRFKYDFNNETKNGKPILKVAKVAVKRADGSYFADVWELDMDNATFAGYMGELESARNIHRHIFTLLERQFLMIKDLQEKVKTLTAAKGATHEEDLLGFSES